MRLFATTSRALPPIVAPPAPRPTPSRPVPEWPVDGRGEAIRTAKARRLGVNVSHRKMNLVARLVRGLTVEEAYRQLAGCVKKTAPVVQQVIAAAVVNAKSYGLRLDRLIVHEAFVGKGQYLVRIRPWHGKGRFGTEHKKYAHLTIVVRELDEELWEFRVVPQYVHLHRSNDSVDDADHSIHASDSVSWVSDLDKGIAHSQENIKGLKIALAEQSVAAQKQEVSKE